MDVQVSEAGWRNSNFQEDNRGKLAVFFHAVQVKNEFQSTAAKRPIFVEKIFIKKLVPGDSLVIDRPIRETDKDEFPVEWARWELKKTNTVQGTPLESWPALSDTQKAEFRALNIFTIDQFAQLGDGAGINIMGFNDLRAKARAFILAAKDSEQFDKIKEAMTNQLAERDAEMVALKAQMAAQAEQMAQLMAVKPARGRPKAVAA